MSTEMGAWLRTLALIVAVLAAGLMAGRDPRLDLISTPPPVEKPSVPIDPTDLGSVTRGPLPPFRPEPEPAPEAEPESKPDPKAVRDVWVHGKDGSFARLKARTNDKGELVIEPDDNPGAIK